jgi:hypothetical protein
MSFVFTLYLADIVTSLSFALAMFSVVALIVTVIYTAYAVEYERHREDCKKSAAKWLTVTIMLMAIAVFLPSKNTLYIMAGLDAAKTALESPEGKQIADKALKIVNEKLDSLAKEAK